MCGIAGVQSLNGTAPHIHILEALRGALHHRGPDGSDVQVFHDVGLLHTRLAIVDPEKGAQPLTDVGRRYAVVVNGEIYNNPKIRESFRETYGFRTNSDSEAVLPLYARYGVAYTHHLRGMYGIALYDTEKKTLFLSRDPFGMKPLYYAENEEGFYFSSELQALLKILPHDLSLNLNAQRELFQLRYGTGSQTLFDRILRVLPGETLVVQNGRIVERHETPFWEKKLETPHKDPLRHFDYFFRDSVEVHLQSDVPVGLFFSGGTDSAAILKVMSDLRGPGIKTYTMGFENEAVHDERSHAQKLAQSLGADHHEYLYKESDFWKDLPLVVKALDDVMFDSAALPTYRLAQEARKDGITVVLSGEGGDELLCGYSRYKKALRPRWLGGRIARDQGTLFKAGLRDKQVDSWRLGLDLLIREAIDLPSLQKAQYIDYRSWLPNDLLIKLDRCLMAHGIEGRTPFLDRPLTQFCFSLPVSEKIRKGHGKWILRQWLESYFPISQPFAKKRGFRVPVASWMAHKNEELGRILSEQPGLLGLFHRDVILDIFVRGGRETEYVRWMFLVYAVWHKIYVLKHTPWPDTIDFLAHRS